MIHHTFIYVPWLIHSYMYHDSPYIHICAMNHHTFICVTWLIRIHVTWLIEVAFLGIDPEGPLGFMRVTRLIHMRGMTHACMWHDTFIYVTWLNIYSYVWLDSHSYMWHVASQTCAMTHFIHVTWLIARRTLSVRVCDMTHAHTCDMSHLIHVTWLSSYMWHDS